MSQLSSEPARSGPLHAGAIARFHLPLVLNAWLMALVGPVLNVALARSPDPQRHLAAFWLAFSVLLLAQSGCLVMQQVTVAALRRRVPLSTTAAAGAAVGAASSLLVLAIAATPLGTWAFDQLLPASRATARLACEALFVLAPVPLVLALRGVLAGVAVSESRTGLVALASASRVAVLSLLCAVVVSGRAGAGAVPAAWALLVAAVADALVVGVLGGARVWRSRARRVAIALPEGSLELLRVALPLTAAALVWGAVRPLVGAVLGRLADPELAQAAFGVVLPILMMSCAPLWGFLEITLVLPRDERDVRALGRFAALTSLAFSLVILAVALSPLRSALLQGAFALGPRLEAAVVPALALLALEPLALSARAIAQGLLLRGGRGALVLALSPVKLAAMAGAGFAIAGLWPQANGAVLALGLILGGDLVDVALYWGAALRTGCHRLHPAERPSAGDAELHLEAA